MVLAEVARGTPFEPYVKSGKDAIKGEHRDRVTVSRGCTLTDTANLEEALGSLSPSDPRWDYAIGWKALESDNCCFVEVHPANTRHVDDVVRKKMAATKLLVQHAPGMLDTADRTRRRTKQPVWHWIRTDAHVDIHPNMPAWRKLRQAGISRPVRRLELR